MSDSRYSQIFEDLKRDLFSVAKRHGRRVLREAVRDAANGKLIQEDDEQESDGDVSPEELDYPDEDVWTVPPHEDDSDEGEDTSKDELSEVGEKVVTDLLDRLNKQTGE